MLIKWSYLNAREDLVRVWWRSHGEDVTNDFWLDYDVDGVRFRAADIGQELPSESESDVVSDLVSDIAFLDGSAFVPVRPQYYVRGAR